jgi:hypothetical protein
MLSSWNEGAAKSAIVDFVARVTKEGGKEYVAPPELYHRPGDGEGEHGVDSPRHFPHGIGQSLSGLVVAREWLRARQDAGGDRLDERLINSVFDSAQS